LDFFCPPESWTCTEKCDVPGVEGVPLRTPAEENVNPDGSAPAFIVQVLGADPPVAWNVDE
jgi:hypothetical protein